MDKNLIVGYCRVSTKEQKKKGYGIKIQERDIKKFAQNNNIEVDYIYKDKAVSGIEESRKELDKLLNYAKRGKLKSVIFPSVDRTARSVRLSENIYYELSKYGVRVYFVNMPYYNPDNDDDVFSRQINEVVAEKNRKNIIKQLEKGRQERVRKGKPPGGTVPYGYDTRKNRRWKLVPWEVGLVRLIFGLAQNHENPFKIAKILNEQGFKMRNGKNWTGQQVIDILSRKELYKEGIIHYGGVKGQNKKLIILTDD